MKRCFSALFLVFVFLLGYNKHAVAKVDLEEVRLVVENFQKVPAHFLLCSDDRWEVNPEISIPKIRQFLGGEMLRLFSWIQCGEPPQPSPLKKERSYYWDFRNGLPQAESSYSKSRVKNLRVTQGKILSRNRAVIKAIFNFYLIEDKEMSTTYTLIREDNKWKIDDIALKGYSTEMEEILPGSKSLKTELQAAYKRAEAKYQKDQQNKTGKKK